MDEREVITAERVKADLISDVKGELLDATLGLLYPAFMCVLMLLILGNVGREFLTDIICYPLTVAVFFILACYIVRLITVIRELRLVKNGGFKVVSDTVKSISEDEFMERVGLFRAVTTVGYRDSGRLFSYRRGRVRIEDAFYFSSYGRVRAYRNVSQYSMVGDKFYLALYPSCNDKVMLMYSSRIYKFEKEI